MNDDFLIQVDNVGKKFCRSLKKSLIYGVQDVGYDLLGVDRSHSELRPGEFWANQGISFELKRGECLGLIGRNGAGKTTLLKMLNGLIKPDQGRITMHGRVGALIALGAGFNPILTGRENIYINGSVLGLSKKEIESKINEIIDFAEIPDFIDTPVQNYSSGMQVRLGFAVATAMNPDIILLDEVLAVGDVAFRAKCYSKIGNLMKKAAVILVSHDLNSIGQACTCGLALDHGKASGPGLAPIEEVLKEYNRLLIKNKKNESCKSEAIINKPLEFGEVKLNSRYISYGESLTVTFECDISECVHDCLIRGTFFSKTGDAVLEWNSRVNKQKVDLKIGKNIISLDMKSIFLRGGEYDFTFLLADSTGLNMLYLWHRGVPVTVNGSALGQAPCQIQGEIFSVK